MEFRTSRDQAGNMATATPGHGGSAGDDFGNIVGQILARRAQNTPQQPMAQQRPAQRGAAAAPTTRIYGGDDGGPQLGQAPIQRQPQQRKDIARYSYGFTPNAWAGTAPHLPTFVGWGREGEDFIMEGGPQNWTGGAMRDPSPSGSAAEDPRMIALQRQQAAARGF